MEVTLDLKHYYTIRPILPHILPRRACYIQLQGELLIMSVHEVLMVALWLLEFDQCVQNLLSQFAWVSLAKEQSYRTSHCLRPVFNWMDWPSLICLVWNFCVQYEAMELELGSCSKWTACLKWLRETINQLINWISNHRHKLNSKVDWFVES